MRRVFCLNRCLCVELSSEPLCNVLFNETHDVPSVNMSFFKGLRVDIFIQLLADGLGLLVSVWEHQRMCLLRFKKSLFQKFIVA